MNDNVQKIHDVSMRILQKTGVKFHHPDAIKLLIDSGIKVKDDIAYFTEDQIMYWIRQAPTAFNVAAKDPKYNMCFGGDNTYNGPSGGATLIQDPGGSLRNATIDDYIKMLRLYEVNEKFYVNGGNPCQPEDILIDYNALILFYLSNRISSKVIFSATGNYNQMKSVIDLAMAVHGVTKEEMIKSPKMFNIVNMNSPLQMDINMTETLFAFLDYRQPMGITSAAMCGTTSPVTIASAIALTNAEVIAGLAVAQMYAPGAPVFYGSQSTNANLRNLCIATGSPEGALCYKYGAEMAKFYKVPSRGGGALTDAKTVNAQAGYESMLTYLACKSSGLNLILHSAGVMDSYMAMSFEKMIVDFEIIDYVDRYLSDISVGNETVPEEVIDNVGPGGSFMMEPHTVKFCRYDQITPHISVRGSFPNATTKLEENIEARIKALLESYKAPDLSPDTIKNMSDLMTHYGVDAKYLQGLEEMLAR